MRAYFNSLAGRPVALAATIAMLLAFACAGNPATATGYSVLYTLQGGPDGQFASGQQVRDKAGNVYGVTLQGGANDTGEIYELSQDKFGVWTKTDIHDFDSFSGILIFPSGALVADTDGNLWGTSQGGANNDGAVFELSRPTIKGQSWTITDIYDFPTGLRNLAGAGPTNIALDGSGNIFGVYEFGEPQVGCASIGCGVLYQLSPSRRRPGSYVENVLHTFGVNAKGYGDIPYNLTRTRNGNMFGTTTGGSTGNGSVWLAAHKHGTWKVTDIHDFCTTVDDYGNCTDGNAPTGGLALDKDGNLYGTTYYGGPELIINDQPITGGIGTVFSLSKANGWSYSQLRVFYQHESSDGNGVFDGWNPAQTLTLDKQGNVYGTTSSGGYESDGNLATGTVFVLASGTWAETNLHTFGPLNLPGTDLKNPSSPLTVDKHGDVFGSTIYNANAQNGGMFEVSP